MLFNNWHVSIRQIFYLRSSSLHRNAPKFAPAQVASPLKRKEKKNKSTVAAQAEKLHWEGGSSRSWADAQIQGMQSVI